MDILGYKTITTTTGAHSCSSGGLNEAQILKIARRGVQQDHLGVLSLADPAATRAWTFLSFAKRIVFLDTIPFEDGEVIYIMYKTSI